VKVRLISPLVDAEQIWIGLDQPGMRRKVFRFVSPATRFVAVDWNATYRPSSLTEGSSL